MDKKSLKYLSTAQAAMMKKNYPKAIKFFNAYLEKVPNDIKASYSLADAYSFEKNNQMAIKYYFIVANKYQKDHFLMKSIAVCKKILKIDPENLRAKDLMDRLYKDKDEEYDSTQQFLRANIQAKLQQAAAKAEDNLSVPQPSTNQQHVERTPEQPQPSQPTQPEISNVSEFTPEPVTQPQTNISQFEVSESPTLAPVDQFSQQEPELHIPNKPNNEKPFSHDTPTSSGSFTALDVFQTIQESGTPTPPVQEQPPAPHEPLVLHKEDKQIVIDEPIELIELDDADLSYGMPSMGKVEEVPANEFEIHEVIPHAPQAPPQFEMPKNIPEIKDIDSTVKFYKYQPKTEEAQSPKLTAKDLLFKELDRSEYRKVVEMMEIRDFDPGQIIVKEGDSGDSMFIIVSGEVSVHTLDKFGKTVFLAKLMEGDFFGEISLLTGKPRTATIISDSATEMLELKRIDLPVIELYCPNFATKLEAFYKKRMKHTVEKIVEQQF